MPADISLQQTTFAAVRTVFIKTLPPDCGSTWKNKDFSKLLISYCNRALEHSPGYDLFPNVLLCSHFKKCGGRGRGGGAGGSQASFTPSTYKEICLESHKMLYESHSPKKHFFFSWVVTGGGAEPGVGAERQWLWSCTLKKKNLEETRKGSGNNNNRKQRLRVKIGKSKPNLTGFLIRTSQEKRRETYLTPQALNPRSARMNPAAEVWSKNPTSSETRSKET